MRLQRAGLFALLLATTVSFGADFQSPRTAALGGAGHAGPLLNDSIYLNPSFTSFLPSYSASANYLTLSENNDLFKARVFNLSVQDGRSELFQAGAGYTLREDGGWLHVGASKGLMQRFGVGIGAKYYFNNPSLQNGTDFMFSATGIVMDDLQAALIIDNIMEDSKGFSRNLYREFILAFKYNIKSLILLYADPHYIPNRPGTNYGYEAGVEIVVMSDLFIRAGAFRNSASPSLRQNARGYGLGLGWIAPRLSLDYSLQRTIEPYMTTAHVFGGTIYF